MSSPESHSFGVYESKSGRNQLGAIQGGKISRVNELEHRNTIAQCLVSLKRAPGPSANVAEGLRSTELPSKCEPHHLIYHTTITALYCRFECIMVSSAVTWSPIAPSKKWQ